jgi:quercetin dioxygenase-like cupin family protein
MKEHQEYKLISVATEEGAQLKIAGGLYRIVVSGKQTNGAYAIIEMTVPSGVGPVPHAHPNIEESFYVLDGEVQFRTNSGTYVAGKGALVAIPKGGLVHHFKNLSEKPAQLLCTVIPAGLDEYFVALSAYLNSIENNTAISPSDKQTAIQRIAEQFGQQLLSPDYWDQAI